MTFEIGEKVVYPNQGVGTIEDISARSFGAQSENFYLLRLVYSSMTVMVPFSNVENIGLRKITKTTEVNRVLEYLATGVCTNCSDWKVRFRLNTDKMQSGNLLQIAEVLKGLLILLADKPLSFREKKMLERARHMVLAEVAIAKNISQEAAIKVLQRALGKANLHLPEVA